MASSSTMTTLVIIDAAVQTYQTLFLNDLSEAELLVLDAERGGVEQITAALASRQNIHSLTIVAHASSESLQLGSAYLSLFNLDRYGWQLQQWGDALAANANILLHSVSPAAPASPFLNRLCLLTGASISIHVSMNPATPLHQTAGTHPLPTVSSHA